MNSITLHDKLKKDIEKSSASYSQDFIKSFYEIIQKMVNNEMDNRYSKSSNNSVVDLNNDILNLIKVCKNLDVKYIPYASISNVVYMTMSTVGKFNKKNNTNFEIKMDDYVEDLRNSIVYVVDHNDVSQNGLTFVLKSIEHYNLACIQSNNLYKSQEKEINEIDNKFTDVKIKYSDINSKFDDIKNKYDEINDLSDKIEKQFDDIDATKGSIYTDFIAILGIFASIIVAMFGGLSAISSSIKAITNEKFRIYSVLMTSSLFSIVLTFIVFMLLVAISKLTGKNIKSCGHGDHCNCNFRKKYPIFFWSIIILMLLFFAFWGISSLTHRY